MKNALLLFSILYFAFSALAVSSVSVQGHEFPFAFEDQTLTETNRQLIAMDIAALWEDQPGSVVQGGTNGMERLFNDSSWATPYQNGLDVPAQIVAVGTNRCVHVSREISDAYLQAFSFAFAHSNEVAAIPGFVAALGATALSNATPAQLSAILCGEGDIAEQRRLEIVSQLAETHFCRPSLMGLQSANEEISTVPANTLLLAVPCHDRLTGKWDIWSAAWLDGRWQLLPLD